MSESRSVENIFIKFEISPTTVLKNNRNQAEDSVQKWFQMTLWVICLQLRKQRINLEMTAFL